VIRGRLNQSEPPTNPTTKEGREGRRRGAEPTRARARGKKVKICRKKN